MAATECLDRIPPAAEIRQRIAQTYQEARALKALLRAAEQRDRLAKSSIRLSADPSREGGRR